MIIYFNQFKMKQNHLKLSLLLFINLIITQVHSYNNVRELPLLMPDVQPTQVDTYFCTAFRTNLNQNEYIVEFKPNATMNTAHHILLFGCQLPGYFERDTPRTVWDCGEMASGSTGVRRANVCNGPQEIIYAWAMDADKLILPKDVGYKIGGDTSINFLVLQVHYANVDKFVKGDTDNSGLILSVVDESTDKIKKRAGVLVLGTAGSLPSKQTVHMESSCRIDEPVELHPFAFRTHTHKLGKAVSGWKVNNDNWELIGRHNPQEPQMFYPVEKNATDIREGDILASRCTMFNHRDHTVNVGATGNDEMCNFYLMYYVDGDRILERKNCFTNGPPIYYWRDDYANFKRPIPKWVDESASKAY